MPSREEIASWLRDGADEILNPYRSIPKKTRIAIGVQQIIDNIRNHAIQVENMRCENCDYWVISYKESKYQLCALLDMNTINTFCCFDYKPKEINHE